MKRNFNQKGQVFLTFVFFIGGILAVVGLLMAFFAASSANTSYGVSAAFTAESVATAGAEDALLKLDRSPAFASAGYTVSSGSSTAAVVVTNPSATNQATILSTATISAHTKKIQVIVSEDASTAAINIISWTEIQ